MSKRVRALRAHASTHNSAVTLFELTEPSSNSMSTPPRRAKRAKLEGEDPVVDLEDFEAHRSVRLGDETKTRRSASASPRKAKPIPQSLEKPHPAPARWRETYDTIKDMRRRIVAPVDTMGCDQAQRKETDPKNRRFATLVSLMLSSQTKDEVTDAAVSKLRDALGGSLTVGAVIDSDEGTISEAISKVNVECSRYIKQTAQRLRDEFDSDVPKTVDELCSLPGVGPKMAFLALQIAWNLNLGIGVDVHVHRITNRLRWHRKPTKTPEETRLNLQSWLPKELHAEINHMLVGFGQTVCLPLGPRCDLCELSTKGLCPSAQQVKSKNRKTLVIAPESAGPQIEIEVDVALPGVEEVESSDLTDLEESEDVSATWK